MTKRKKSKPWCTVEIVQEGLVVASVDAPDWPAAWNEGMRYAFQYAQDGEVWVREKGTGKSLRMVPAHGEATNDHD